MKLSIAKGVLPIVSGLALLIYGVLNSNTLVLASNLPNGGGHTPVKICHATSSNSNPYVEITVDDDGAYDGHTFHGDDIIPAPAIGCPKGNKPSPSPKASVNPSPKPSDKPNGKITICHATDSQKNPYVKITIDENGLNGHNMHRGDIIPAPAEGCPGGSITVNPSPTPNPSNNPGCVNCSTNTCTDCSINGQINSSSQSGSVLGSTPATGVGSMAMLSIASMGLIGFGLNSISGVKSKRVDLASIALGIIKEKKVS